MRLLGRRARRIEDPELIRGEATYVADLALPGCTYLTFARSTVSHALITVDLERVRRMPGVLAAYSAAELGLPDIRCGGLPGTELDVAGVTRAPLARERVRFVGEPVAAIVVEDPYLGEDAAALVDITYKHLPAVIDPSAAARDEVLLHPAAGTNIVKSFDLGEEAGEDEKAMADVVLSRRFVNQRLQPAPMEPRACVASWEPEGRVTVWLSTQAPHLARQRIAEVLGVELERVRMRAVAVGGGFGAKVFPTPEELLVPVLSRDRGRPVKWVETRSESMLALPAGRGQVTTATLHADRSAKVWAVEYDVLQDAGAYPGLGAFMPGVGWLVASGPYAIPRLRMRGRSVATTTAPTGPYRGAGRPEPAYVLERMMDLLAAELGLDPAEVRRRNLIAADSYPYTSATGTTYDSGNPRLALARVLEAARYEELRREQARRRQAGDSRRLGIGLAAFVDIAGRSSPTDFGAVEVCEDGTTVIRTGSGPTGQGHATVWATIVAERLGIPPDRDVRVVHTDTDEVPVGGGTYGSKSLQSAGTAVHLAAVGLVERGRRQAAALLEADHGEVVLDLTSGSFHVVGAPSHRLTWAELARAAAAAGERLYEEVRLEGSRPTIPSGAYLAVVSLDLATCEARVERMVTCDDAGRIMNPLVAEGQVQGGLLQGIAQALFEEQRYDEDGNPLTATFLDYLILSAGEAPEHLGLFLETPSDRNPLGVKGIGESGAIGAAPAVANAVLDALSEFGVRHLDMPLTPDRIWQALEDGDPDHARARG